MQVLQYDKYTSSMLGWLGVKAFCAHMHTVKLAHSTFFQSFYSHTNKHTPAELAHASKLMVETKMLFYAARHFTPFSLPLPPFSCFLVDS